MAEGATRQTRRRLGTEFVLAVWMLVSLAACGGSPSSAQSPGSGSGSVSGARSGSSVSTCRQGQYIGNRRTKALHPPGGSNLPSPRNQVCFDSATAGEQAGYHLVGSGGRSSSGSQGSSGSQPTGRTGTGTQPSRETLVIPGRPRPREEFFDGCPPTGASFGDPELNLLKNRIDRATSPHQFTVQQFVALPWPHAVSTNRIKMRDWSSSQRRVVYRSEGMPAAITGYISSTKLEGSESPNCEGTAGFDWHVWIGPSPHGSRGDAVITESTPRIRAREHGFNLQRLAGYQARGTRVRITGWAMLDYEHPEQLGWDRATLWELHPITQVEIQSGGRWVTIAG